MEKLCGQFHHTYDANILPETCDDRIVLLTVAVATLSMLPTIYVPCVMCPVTGCVSCALDLFAFIIVLRFYILCLDVPQSLMQS